VCPIHSPSRRTNHVRVSDDSMRAGIQNIFGPLQRISIAARATPAMAAIFAYARKSQFVTGIGTVGSSNRDRFAPLFCSGSKVLSSVGISRALWDGCMCRVLLYSPVALFAPIEYIVTCRRTPNTDAPIARNAKLAIRPPRPRPAAHERSGQQDGCSSDWVGTDRPGAVAFLGWDRAMNSPRWVLGTALLVELERSGLGREIFLRP
jgi:hypothetical protein